MPKTKSLAFEVWAKDCQGIAKRVGDNFTDHFGETFVDYRNTEVVPTSKIVWYDVNSY